MDKQTLNSLLGNTQTQAQQQDLINQIVDKIQPQLQLLVTVGIAVSVLVTVLVVINWFYKWRVERAILRMDKNIQKLVELQTGSTVGDKKSAISNAKNELEQK